MSNTVERINPFQLNAAFIKDLRQRLSSKKAEMLDSFPDSDFFPNVSQLKAIIETLMWASVQHEEGRLTRLKVGFSQPTPYEHLGLIFRQSKALSVEELRRLAPAVLPPDGQIGVWPLGSGKKLRIWGLQTNNLHGTTFEIIDPGRLVVKFMGKFVVAAFNGNEAGFISSHWNNHYSDLLYGRYTNLINHIEVAEGFFWSQMMEEILRRIRLLRHGGTLLFVNDDDRWKNSVDPLFYECERYLDKVRPIFLQLKRQLEKINVNDEIGQKRVMALRSAIEFNLDNQASIGNAARAIAYMSSIDGATILDSDFRVLAFAAKISPLKRPKSMSVKIVSPFEESTRITRLEKEFRGTRHQSAARFVNANPNTRAFVVSQDGEVTGISWSEEGDERCLTVCRGLELIL